MRVIGSVSLPGVNTESTQFRYRKAIALGKVVIEYLNHSIQQPSRFCETHIPVFCQYRYNIFSIHNLNSDSDF